MATSKIIIHMSKMVSTLLQHHLIIHALEIGQVLVLVLILLDRHYLLGAHSAVLLHLHYLTLTAIERAMGVLNGDALAVGRGTRLGLLALGPRIVHMRDDCLLMMRYLLYLKPMRLIRLRITSEDDHMLGVTCTHFGLRMRMLILDI